MYAIHHLHKLERGKLTFNSSKLAVLHPRKPSVIGSLRPVYTMADTAKSHEIVPITDVRCSTSTRKVGGTRCSTPFLERIMTDSYVEYRVNSV